MGKNIKEAAENFWLNDDSMSDNDRISYINGFIAGAKLQQQNSYNDKKEFAISFSRFLDIQRINFPCIYYSKNIHELLEIYQDENRG
jgi:hypothetical protein